MNKPNPSKRKSIHDNKSLDEITDNVKNNAIVTRSKTVEKLQKEVNDNRNDENGLNELSSDDEEISNDVQARRRLNNKEQETHLKHRSRQKRNISSDSEAFNSNLSMSHDPLQNVESEARKKYSKQQMKKTDKDNLSSAFQTNKNIGKNKTANHNTYTSSHQNSGCYYFWIFLLICFVLSIYFWRLYQYPESDEESNINILKCEKGDEQCITDNVKRTLKSMKAQYTNQDDNLWREVFVGIKSIIHDPKRPSIIVLLGDKTDSLNCLAVMLGNVSSNALNSGLLKLTPEKFENDMGDVITSLRSIIKDKKAVIVWDLLNINEEALKAFHNLCDRINPLVEEVIYIITIIADDYDKSIKPLEYVENKLYQKLSGKIKEDAIQPLITRITDGPVLAVKPEPDLIECPLPKVSKQN